MATKAMEAPQRSISAPGILDLPRGRRAASVSDSLDVGLSAIGEKPFPNYLKPTISSSQTLACTYPKKHNQPSESPMAAAAGKCHHYTKSVDGLLSLSSLSQRSPSASAAGSKERAPRAAPHSPKAGPERVPPTTPKTAKGRTLRKTKSLPRSGLAAAIPAASSIKTEVKEKVLTVDVVTKKAAKPPEVDARKAPEANNKPQKPSPPKSKDHKESLNPEVSEESLKGEAKKPRVSHPKVARRASISGEGELRKSKLRKGREAEGEKKEVVAEKLKFKQSRAKKMEEGKAEKESLQLRKQEAKGKEMAPAYNDVIEETAAKLAARRSKVRALVGAFETVISLHEIEGPQPAQQQEEAKGGEEGGPAGQPSQQEEAVKEAEAEAKAKHEGEGGDASQPSQQPEEEEGRKEREGGQVAADENSDDETGEGEVNRAGVRKGSSNE